LTEKEREVLRCFLDGITVNEIAAKFSRSKKTVSGHKQSALRKLGIRSDNDLFKVRHLI
ncbi:MAG TPA: DNA-binding response regulator, partial [Cupriavidus sp.]|nr:DNA-binding response regulator [Cupriavidus sp.]